MLNYDKDENLVSVQVSKATQRSLLHSGRVTYDPQTDTLTIILARKPVAESDEEMPGVILDYDTVGNLVSLEILDVTPWVEQPDQIARNFALQRQRFRYSHFKRK
ncbi:MAG: DUF2283 domain-containing protein [Gloeomargaritaceae cyanobacterium C42_A2020_066]|nr:DUF2283 domain-containing protein [Gloeomargaritaceae cyanobacterium C42_A2020_066]